MIELSAKLFPIGKTEEWNCTIAQVYFSTIGIDQEPARVLYLPFEQCSNIVCIAIDIEGEVIGVPEKRNEIQVFEKMMLIPETSRRIIPLTFGEHQRIFNYSFDENEIQFNTFGQLKVYGESVRLIRQKGF